jgi:hypothetical protein
MDLAREGHGTARDARLARAPPREPTRARVGTSLPHCPGRAPTRKRNADESRRAVPRLERWHLGREGAGGGTLQGMLMDTLSSFSFEHPGGRRGSFGSPSQRWLSWARRSRRTLCGTRDGITSSSSRRCSLDPSDPTPVYERSSLWRSSSGRRPRWPGTSLRVTPRPARCPKGRAIASETRSQRRFGRLGKTERNRRQTCDTPMQSASHTRDRPIWRLTVLVRDVALPQRTVTTRTPRAPARAGRTPPSPAPAGPRQPAPGPRPR